MITFYKNNPLKFIEEQCRIKLLPYQKLILENINKEYCIFLF